MEVNIYSTNSKTTVALCGGKYCTNVNCVSLFLNHYKNTKVKIWVFAHLSIKGNFPICYNFLGNCDVTI